MRRRELTELLAILLHTLCYDVAIKIRLPCYCEEHEPNNQLALYLHRGQALLAILLARIDINPPNII